MGLIISPDMKVSEMVSNYLMMRRNITHLNKRLVLFVWIRGHSSVT